MVGMSLAILKLSRDDLLKLRGGALLSYLSKLPTTVVGRVDALFDVLHVIMNKKR
jgi:hypothetical protein